MAEVASTAANASVRILMADLTPPCALTGWHSPARGGSRSSQLGPEQRQRDLSARLLLLHRRDHSTSIYLGVKRPDRTCSTRYVQSTVVVQSRGFRLR